MGELWNSTKVKDFLNISPRSLANYISNGKLPVAEVQGRANMFLPSVVVDLQSTVEDGKAQRGLSEGSQGKGERHASDDVTTPSPELNEVGNTIIDQIILDMQELGIDHKNFSIQIHETALNYQYYKHYQTTFIKTTTKDFLTFSNTFYKNYNDGLKTLGLTPSDLAKLKGAKKGGGQSEMDFLDDVLTRQR